MNDKQLLEHSPEQARQKLTDEQLERYNELQKEQLTQEIDEEKEKDSEKSLEGLCYYSDKTTYRQ